MTNQDEDTDPGRNDRRIFVERKHRQLERDSWKTPLEEAG